MSMQTNLTEQQKELLQKWANANVTVGCAGHYKGEQNKVLRERYALELRNQSIIVPKDFSEMVDHRNGKFQANVELPQGIFNGVGSY